MSDLRKSDHGVYECVVSNEVATIVARTALLIERTTPHAPTNVTVSSSETFAVTVEWMPGYSGCSSCQQSYRIRYKKFSAFEPFKTYAQLCVRATFAKHKNHSNRVMGYRVCQLILSTTRCATKQNLSSQQEGKTYQNDPHISPND